MANLQEEIFESEDLKEIEDAKDDDDQNAQPITDEPTSANVIEEQIRPSAAFQIYAGQLYDPAASASASQSSNIGRSSRIYDTTQSKDINFESPLQTYKRLQFEIEAFKQKLNDIAEKV